jgi:biofilm PGA synthesis N-glycosyltransferase PgaC
LHRPERAGKIAAVHRAMEYVDTEVVVFTDANTFLNPEAITRICRHYSDKTVGAVAGEKRVQIDATPMPAQRAKAFTGNMNRP